MMAYMKWVSLIRDAVREQQDKGMLGVLAAISQIQEYRLRDWVTTKTIDDLSHAELTKLHEVLANKATVEGDHNGLSAPQPERNPQQSLFADVSGCSVEQERGFSFDSSD
jgi:hypothetical protein